MREAGGSQPSLARLGALGLWLGVAGFGGGYAITQRIRRSVEDNGWMSETEFTDCLSVATALPGTAATHLLTLVGLRLRGWRGALLGASSFLAPSFVLMVAFAAAYDRLRGLHALGAFLDGMGFATVGVVAAVAVELGRAPGRRRLEWALTLVAFGVLAARVVGLAPLVAVAACFGALVLRPKRDDGSSTESPFGPESMRAVMVALPWALPASLVVFAVFAKIGLATFGGGFAMIPALERETVRDHAWLTESEFNDAMVLGQITPGPVAIAATFIGYRVSGLAGGIIATLGMFGPPFLVAVAAGRSLQTFRDHPLLRGALRAIAPVVVGIIAASAVALWRTSVHDFRAALIAAAAFVTLVVFRRLSPLVPLGVAGAVQCMIGS